MIYRFKVKKVSTVMHFCHQSVHCSFFEPHPIYAIASYLSELNRNLLSYLKVLSMYPMKECILAVPNLTVFFRLISSIFRLQQNFRASIVVQDHFIAEFW